MSISEEEGREQEIVKLRKKRKLRREKGEDISVRWVGRGVGGRGGRVSRGFDLVYILCKTWSAGLLCFFRGSG